eukprot:Pgem_evm1s19802
MEKVTCTKCQGKGFLMEDTQKKAEKANQKIKAKEIQDDDPDDIKEMKKYKSVYKATTLIEILEFGWFSKAATLTETPPPPPPTTTATTATTAATAATTHHHTNNQKN